MIVQINSRRIDSHKLKIYADGALVFEDYMFSNPKGRVDLGRIKCSELKFEYRYLSKEEEKWMSVREDAPEWGGIIAYDGWNSVLCNSSSSIDWIGRRFCPEPAEGLYMTVISNIPSDMECIKVLFRRSALNDDMPNLSVMDREARHILKVKYERKKNYIDIMKSAKRSAFKFLLHDFVIMIGCFLLLFIVETYFPKRILIAIFAVLSAACFLNLFNLIKCYRSFFKKVQHIRVFRQEKGKVIPLE